MFDTCFCLGLWCPLKDSCRRYIVKPDDISLMFLTPLWSGESKECPVYLPVDEGGDIDDA